MKQPRFSFFSLGGIGEVGLNCYVFDFGDECIIVDLGIGLPDSASYGVNVMLPDISVIDSLKARVAGIIFTHGHDDHVGAYPYLKRFYDVPVYGSAFAVELVASKMRARQHGEKVMKKAVVLKGPNPSVTIGKQRVSFFSTEHSVPQSYGFSFNTPWGACIFTSDFKHIKNMPRFQNRPFALFADSTNAEFGGEEGSVKEMRDTFDRVLKETKGAVVASAFSTNVERMGMIMEAAEKHDRRIFVTGKNMETSFSIARKLNLIKQFRTHDWNKIHHTPRHKVLAIVTGTQGERFAPLNLISQGNFKGFSIRKGDSVLISSSVIPGNEKSVYGMLNRLSEKGVALYYSKTHTTHVSGHSSRKDLEKLIAKLNPQYVIPVHGEIRQLYAHKNIAVQAGIPPERVIILKNGCAIDAIDGAFKRTRVYNTGRIFVDRNMSVLGENVIKERKKMADDGVVSATVMIHPKFSCTISLAGIVDENNFTGGLKRQIREFCSLNAPEAMHDHKALRDSITTIIKGYAKKQLLKKPVVIVHIVEDACY